MAAIEGPDRSLLVNPQGEPLVSQSKTSDTNVRTRLLQLLIESTATIGIGTAVMFYLGHIYYQNFFRAFGSPLLFPPLGTSEYLTKAFDLTSTRFVYYLGVVWIVTFVVILEWDEDIRRLQALFDRITEQNRVLGSLQWEIWGLRRKRRKQLRELKKHNYSEYQKEIKQDHDSGHYIRPELSHLWFKFFPYHVSLRGVLVGVRLNLYIFLTVMLVIVTAVQLDAMSPAVWVTTGIFAAIGLLASLLGKSAYHMLRERLTFSLSSRLYLAFVTLVLIVATAQFLVAGVGKYDARQFMSGKGAGSYLTILDVRSDRPDLEGRTFRVLIHRTGAYYLVPADQTDLERATLVVVPLSEISRTRLKQ